jgi:ABC-type dipeptide/oligopeptide/nickel transport system ATPase component
MLELVNAAHEAALGAVRPGAPFREFRRAASTVLAEGLADWGLLPVTAAESLVDDSGLHRRYTVCAPGHMLGLDARLRRRTFGQVLDGASSAERAHRQPGVYFQSTTSPSRSGFAGVRIEDDVSSRELPRPVRTPAASPGRGRELDDRLAASSVATCRCSRFMTCPYPSSADGIVRPRGISFEVDRGRTLGIVGESGSGKSVAAQTILGLTEGARVSGHVSSRVGISSAEREQLRHGRGAEVALIFQDPLRASTRCTGGMAIVEAVRRTNRSPATPGEGDRALRRVGIPSPSRVDAYPHQFSGGMRQRALIAMALALNPKLLIADEPTTALDVTVQAQIVELMRTLQAEFDTAIIAITHDLGVLADLADDVLVMYAGRVMEYGDRRTLYGNPTIRTRRG